MIWRTTHVSVSGSVHRSILTSRFLIRPGSTRGLRASGRQISSDALMPGHGVRDRSEMSVITLSPPPPAPRIYRDPTAPDPAVPIRILRQVLLVVVSPEAGNPTETTPLHARWSSTGRLPVDVDVDPAVGQPCASRESP